MWMYQIIQLTWDQINGDSFDEMGEAGWELIKVLGPYYDGEYKFIFRMRGLENER